LKRQRQAKGLRALLAATADLALLFSPHPLLSRRYDVLDRQNFRPTAAFDLSIGQNARRGILEIYLAPSLWATRLGRVSVLAFPCFYACFSRLH
jgi:hypothetical protein